VAGALAWRLERRTIGVVLAPLASRRLSWPGRHSGCWHVEGIAVLVVFISVLIALAATGLLYVVVMEHRPPPNPSEWEPGSAAREPTPARHRNPPAVRHLERS
jgi:hypothetical protein